MSEYIKNDNNFIYQTKTRTGKLSNKLLGVKCPYCGSFSAENKNYKEWLTDALVHISDCHKERLV